MATKLVKVTRDQEYGFDTENGDNVEVAAGAIFITSDGKIALALDEVDDDAFPSLEYNPKDESSSITETYLECVTHYAGHENIQRKLDALTKVVSSLDIKMPRLQKTK
jgi:hypothetical protein